MHEMPCPNTDNHNLFASSRDGLPLLVVLTVHFALPNGSFSESKIEKEKKREKPKRNKEKKFSKMVTINKRGENQKLRESALIKHLSTQTPTARRTNSCLEGAFLRARGTQGAKTDDGSKPSLSHSFYFLSLFLLLPSSLLSSLSLSSLFSLSPLSPTPKEQGRPEVVVFVNNFDAKRSGAKQMHVGARRELK